MNSFVSRRTVFALGAVALVGSGIAAYATIPGTDGLIRGCYASNGAMRVIDYDAGQRCSKSEKMLTWNQTGPQGPQGPQGPRGPSDAIAYLYQPPTGTVRVQDLRSRSLVTLTEGAWTIDGKLVGNSYEDVFVTCQILAGGNFVAEVDTPVHFIETRYLNEEIVGHVVVPAGQAETLMLNCFVNCDPDPTSSCDTSQAYFQYITLNATHVGAISEIVEN